MPREINQAGLELIKSFEDFSPTPYLCPAGVWTIGWGHTKGVHRRSPAISEAEGERLLREDLDEAEAAVERLITVPLGDNQFAALVSFAFNLGAGALAGSTLRRLLNRGDYEAVAVELPKWRKATDRRTGRKVVMPGLVRRRAAEVALWLKDAPPLPARSMPQAASK